MRLFYCGGPVSDLVSVPAGVIRMDGGKKEARAGERPRVLRGNRASIRLQLEEQTSTPPFNQ
jgi:hypothetical protein